MTKAAIYKEIHRQYERIRACAAQEQRRRQTLVYEEIPRIAEIDHLTALTGVKIAKMVLKQPSDVFSSIVTLREELTALKIEKRTLLKERGLEEQYMDLKYSCEKCKDTGYIDTKPCSCFQQKLIDIVYNQSNLKDIVKVENFDTFDFRLYSQQKDEKEGASPYDNIQHIFRTCIKFVQEFDVGFENLLLYGSTGLGKTFLCNCIAKELMDSGKTVLYTTAAQLFKMLEDERFHKDEENISSDYMNDILSADLFIIDDLGTEFSTILSSAELFHIINTRILDKKPVILSTNLALQDFINQYSDRIVSRISGFYSMLKFFGEDIRMKKRFKH